jgi:hypothetical protein
LSRYKLRPKLARRSRDVVALDGATVAAGLSRNVRPLSGGPEDAGHRLWSLNGAAAAGYGASAADAGGCDVAVVVVAAAVVAVAVVTSYRP